MTEWYLSSDIRPKQPNLSFSVNFINTRWFEPELAFFRENASRDEYEFLIIPENADCKNK
jgi:hypothetical protein